MNGSARWQCIIIKHFAKRTPDCYQVKLWEQQRQQQEQLRGGNSGSEHNLMREDINQAAVVCGKKGVEHVNFSILLQNWPCFVPATIPHTGYIGLRPGPFTNPEGEMGYSPGPNQVEVAL